MGTPVPQSLGAWDVHLPAMEQAHPPHHCRPPQQGQAGSFWVHCPAGGRGAARTHCQQPFRLPGHCSEEMPGQTPGTACPDPHQRLSSLPSKPLRLPSHWKRLLLPGLGSPSDCPSCSLAVVLPALCFPSGVSAPGRVPQEQPPGLHAVWSLLPPPQPWPWCSCPTAGLGQASTCTACRLRSPGAGRRRTAPPCRSAACPNASPGPRLLLLLQGACFPSQPGAEESQESD